MKTKAKAKKAPVRKRSTATVAARPKKRVAAAAAPRRKKVSPKAISRGKSLAGRIELPATLKWVLGLGSVVAIALGATLLSSRDLGTDRATAAAPTATAPVAESTSATPADPAAAPASAQAEGWKPFLALLGAMSREEGPTVGSRVDFWSELLLSSQAAHEKLRSLVANRAIDDVAPLVPTKFDCTTYVETVLSLARSRRPDDFTQELMRVRYRTGNATYRDRNHFPEADWLPNNSQAGVIRDITAELGQATGVSRGSVRKQVRMREWVEAEVNRGRVDRSIASVSDARWNTQEVEVTYLPLEFVSKYAAKIPHGSILNIVRKDMPKRPVLITHQGFVIQKDGKTLFRHANPGGQIRTEPLSQYLVHASERRAGGSILGLNVNEIRTN